MKQMVGKEDDLNNEDIQYSMSHNNMMNRDMGMQYSATNNQNSVGDMEYGKQMHQDNNKYNMYDYSYPFEGQHTVQPLYVNAKQINWIKKRKTRRDILDTLMISIKNGYLHESRHRHAMKRMRAPTGRFMTKAEMENFLKEKEGE